MEMNCAECFDEDGVMTTTFLSALMNAVPSLARQIEREEGFTKHESLVKAVAITAMSAATAAWNCAKTGVVLTPEQEEAARA